MPKQWSFVMSIFFSLLGYWVLGNSIFIFPILLIFFDRRQNRCNFGKWAVVSLFVFSIPFFLRERYLLTMIQAYIYPDFKLQSSILPLILILILFINFAVRKIEIDKLHFINFSAFIIGTILLIGGIKMKANFNFEKILSLDSEFYFGNTNRVIELAQKYKSKNKYISYYTNMALTQKGVLPDKLFNYYQPATFGLMLPVNPDESWQTILFSNEVFFLTGDMNLAQHSAMLGMTFSPYQRSSRLVKRLAEINLLNEDSSAAKKYLRLLEKTLFHKKWAESRIKLLRKDSLNSWLIRKRSLLPQNDTIRKSYDYMASLNFLVEQNPQNIIALDYLLCHHLLNKDLKSFRKIYDRYGQFMHRSVPSSYSEALLIQLYTSECFASDVINYGIPPQKVKDFLDYTAIFEKTNGTLNQLEEKFGNTYWFYYHFATLQKK